MNKSGMIILLGASAFIAGWVVAETLPKTGREPLPMHRHEHPRVIIALTGGTMKILEASGQSETHDWQTGKAYWLPANAPGTQHQDVNVGDKPIEVMVVELQNAK
jgi:hypothetical protein